MKKSLVVLLIAVLVAGSAFAAVTGTASLSFGYDMQDEDFALVNTGVEGAAASFTFAVDSQSGATAASDKAVYAKAAGEYSLAIKDGVLASELTFTEAYVMGEGWSVDFTSVENGLKVEALGATLTGWYKQKGDWGIKVESGDVEIVDGLTASAYFSYAKVQDDEDNVDNYAIDLDIDDDYELYLKKYEDGTYKNAYIQSKAAAKKAWKTSVSDLKEIYLADPTNGAKYKKYADACDEYADAVAAYEKALTVDGMLKAWATGKFTSATQIGDFYSTTTNWYLDGDKVTDIAKINDKYMKDAKSDLSKIYTSTTDAKLNKEADRTFLGTHTVATGLDVAYTGIFDAEVSFDIVVENDEVDSWNVGGEFGYDFASANVGINDDKVLNAGIAVDLSSFLGYGFSFSVAGNDMLEKDDDIDRDLVIGLDTTFAGLSFGFDGTINFTDEDVAFAFALGYDKFSVGIKWTAPWEDDFELIDEKMWTIGVNAAYAGDHLTAKANILVENVGDYDHVDKVKHAYTVSNRKVSVGASVETDALIDNATVGVEYTDGVYMYGYDHEDGKSGLDDGAVKAFIKVAF